MRHKVSFTRGVVLILKHHEVLALLSERDREIAEPVAPRLSDALRIRQSEVFSTLKVITGVPDEPATEPHR
jgi:hypothetical protein